MTVTYTAEVATCRWFGCFWKLLFRWKGSIYKLLWPELTVYILSYYFLSLIYRFSLTCEQKKYFEKVSLYCNFYADLIPVTFVLGFYISIVLKRWWDQFVSIPWPDPLALFVSASIHGQDEHSRLMRRTIMRYVNLSLVMTLTCISTRVKKRFPTLDHLQEAGILLPNEKKIVEELNMKTPQYPKYWMPLVWASSVVTRARKEGRIRDDFAVKTLIDELCSFRGQCGGLFIYDWISIPLVYTQVVTLAVYTFFLATIMGRQYLDPSQGYQRHEIDLYVPIFTLLQFFFYMGWLKVAETLVNPFGEDDDDFEMNWLIDRNIQVSYLIVDEMHQEHPELIKDQYWDEVMPVELPYTAAAEQYRREPPKGSAVDINIPDHEAEFIPMETLMEENMGLQTERTSSVARESGILCSLSRQLSTRSSRSSHSGTSNLRISHQRPSMLSMIQKFFSRDAQIMNSNLSLHSHRKLNKRLSCAGSTSRISSFTRKSDTSSFHSSDKDVESPGPVSDVEDDENILSFTVRNETLATVIPQDDIIRTSNPSINCNEVNNFVSHKQPIGIKEETLQANGTIPRSSTLDYQSTFGGIESTETNPSGNLYTSVETNDKLHGTNDGNISTQNKILFEDESIAEESVSFPSPQIFKISSGKKNKAHTLQVKNIKGINGHKTNFSSVLGHLLPGNRNNRRRHRLDISLTRSQPDILSSAGIVNSNSVNILPTATLLTPSFTRHRNLSFIPFITRGLPVRFSHHAFPSSNEGNSRGILSTRSQPGSPGEVCHTPGFPTNHCTQVRFNRSSKSQLVTTENWQQSATNSIPVTQGSTVSSTFIPDSARALNVQSMAPEMPSTKGTNSAEEGSTGNRRGSTLGDLEAILENAENNANREDNSSEADVIISPGPATVSFVI